ncbi:sialic acid-binding Ig-like lectin 5 isoform X2 [Heptranchias perlo]|uniref:sialic acid-binding Ig-like lectin 5 isoform X2 n=1 Tax=Heptranchias perlo TaxID=212740 RepID=UPI00355A5172
MGLILDLRLWHREAPPVMKSIKFILILIISKVVHSSRWSVAMPWFVSAESGSCAEIPCTFDYPVYGRNPRGMWLKGGSDLRTRGVSIVYDPRGPGNIHFNYRERAEFCGDFAKKRCSLRIKDIRKSDEGEYYFRLNITNVQNTTEGYSSGTYASLSILEVKTPGKNGNRFERSRKVSSTCSFTPSPGHHGIRLGCKFMIDGVAATVQETLTLDVLSPMTSSAPHTLLKPIVNSSIVAVEGSSVLLYCTAQGKLPVSLRWVRDGSEIKMSSTGELRQIFHNISSKDDGQYWCVAENIVGKANSSTQISVQYKPTIVSGPTCISSESGIHCTCSVRAKPPTNITWGLNGRNITRYSSDGEVVSWAVTGHLVQSSLILIHPTRTRNQISCVAANVHGVSVGKYQHHLAGRRQVTPLMSPQQTAIQCLMLWCSTRLTLSARATMQPWVLEGLHQSNQLKEKMFCTQLSTFQTFANMKAISRMRSSVNTPQLNLNKNPV